MRETGPTPEQAQVSRKGTETEKASPREKGGTQEYSHSEDLEDQKKKSRMTGEDIGGDRVIVKVPG